MQVFDTQDLREPAKGQVIARTEYLVKLRTIKLRKTENREQTHPHFKEAEKQNSKVENFCFFKTRKSKT